MKIALITTLIITGFSAGAFAAGQIDKLHDTNSGTFAVEKMICNHVYIPATGVQSPTYQAGIDARGQPVPPADVTTLTNSDQPDYVEVPMTIDLAQRMGLNAALNAEAAEMKLPVANLKLYQNGKVEYNGQDISSHAASLCGSDKTSQKVIETPGEIEPAAGQDQMISAPSVTINPDPRNDYQSDRIAPADLEPQAGSVAASSTSTPPARKPIQVQQSTVNMGARNSQ